MDFSMTTQEPAEQVNAMEVLIMPVVTLTGVSNSSGPSLWVALRDETEPLQN
jgi:hypothetical protein